MAYHTMLHRIIEAIDKELDRLRQARDILAAYAGDGSRKPRKQRSKRERQQSHPQDGVAPTPQVEVTLLPSALEPRRRDRSPRSLAAEPRALTSRFPVSPVAVAPSHLRRAPSPPAENLQRSDFGERILAEERKLSASLSS